MSDAKQEQEFGDPTTAPFWAAARNRRLVVQKCRSCGHHQFYPRPMCLECGEPDPAWAEVSGNATLYSLSEVHMAPSPDYEVPYVVAIVELEEGPKLMTNIVGGTCAIGDRVRLVWEDREGYPPLPMFTPVED